MADSIIKEHRLDIVVGGKLDEKQMSKIKKNITKFAAEWQNEVENAKVGAALDSGLEDALKQINKQLSEYKLAPISIDQIKGFTEPFAKLGELAIQKFADGFSGGGNIINSVTKEIGKIYDKLDKQTAHSAESVIKSVSHIEDAAKRMKNPQWKKLEKTLTHSPKVPKDQSASVERLKGYYNAGIDKDVPWESRYAADVNFVDFFSNFQLKLNKKGINIDDVLGDELSKLFKDRFVQLRETYLDKSNMLQNVMALRDPQNPKPFVGYDTGEPWAREDTLQEIKGILQEKGNNIRTDDGNEKANNNDISKSKKVEDLKSSKPIIVYRAIYEPDEEEDKGRSRKEVLESWGGAEYWTNQREVAETYTEGMDNPVLLKGAMLPKNPLIIDGKGKQWNDFISMPDIKDKFPELYSEIEANKYEFPEDIQQKLNEIAKQLGHDVVIMENIIDAMNPENYKKPSNTYAILDDNILTVQGGLLPDESEESDDGFFTFPSKGYSKDNIPEYYKYPVYKEFLKETVQDNKPQEQIQNTEKTSDNVASSEIVNAINSISEQVGILAKDETIKQLKDISDISDNPKNETNSVAIDESSLKGVLESVTYKVNLGEDIKIAESENTEVIQTLKSIETKIEGHITQEKTLQEINGKISGSDDSVNTNKNEDTSKNLEEAKKIISIQKDWLRYLDPVLNDEHFKTSGKKEATDQLRRATEDLINYRKNPDEYKGYQYAEEKAIVKWNKAYQEAQRQGVAASTLSRYNTGEQWSYEKNLEKLQKEREFNLKTIAEQEAVINSLQQAPQKNEDVERVAIDEASLKGVLESVIYKVNLGEDVKFSEPENTEVIQTLKSIETKVGEHIAQEKTLQEINSKIGNIQTSDKKNNNIGSNTQITDKAVLKEKASFETLETSIQEVIKAINSKTAAFIQEGKTVGRVIGKEISGLIKLQSHINDINDTVLKLIGNLRNIKTASKADINVNVNNSGNSPAGVDRDEWKQLEEQHKKLGQLRARFDDTVDPEIYTETLNLQDEIDFKYKSLNLTQEEIKALKERAMIAEKSEKRIIQDEKDKAAQAKEKADNARRASDIKALGDQYEKLGKLQAQGDAGDAGKVEEARQLEEIVKQETERLKLNEAQNAEILESLQLKQQEAKESRALVLAAKQDQKDANKAFREEVKAAQKEKGVQRANSTINAANNTFINTIGNEGMSADIANKALELKEATKELNQIKTEMDKSIINDDVPLDQTELNQQIKKVQELKLELDRINQIHNKYSGDNATTISGDVNSFQGLNIDEYEKQLTSFAQASVTGRLRQTQFNAETKELTGTVRTGANTFKTYSFAVDEVSGELKKLQTSTKKTETFLEGINRKMREAAQYVVGSLSIYDVWNKIKQGVQYVKEIDSALTELKKVTDETEESYDKFLDTASKTASKVGSTIQEVVSSTADWARLGYTIQEAHQLAESTQILMNVSEFTDVSTATDSLISSIQAFKYTAEESMDVVDILNTIGNNYAISTADLATSLTKSSGSLVAANGTLEEAVALTATANTIIQDADVVGK